MLSSALYVDNYGLDACHSNVATVLKRGLSHSWWNIVKQKPSIYLFAISMLSTATTWKWKKDLWSNSIRTIVLHYYLQTYLIQFSFIFLLCLSFILSSKHDFVFPCNTAAVPKRSHFHSWWNKLLSNKKHSIYLVSISILSTATITNTYISL